MRSKVRGFYGTTVQLNVFGSYHSSSPYSLSECLTIFLGFFFFLLIQAGRKLIEDAVDQLREWKRQGMSAEEAFEKFQKVRDEVIAKKNLYVEDLLARHRTK